MPKIVILTEGKSGPDTAKTAAGLLRYRAQDVVAVLDSRMAGARAGDVFGVGGDTPIVGNLSAVEADTLVIGIAPAGGDLPRAWRPAIRRAIRRGMDVVSGLHYFLSEDRELSALAAKHRVRLVDVRKPPAHLTISADLARRTRCHRVHTVGQDCSVGKMVAAIEITRGLKERGRNAEFVATGQTGILISGWGPPVDRVISDFVAGAIETAVLEHQDREFLLIEGQGSLLHPFYSGVTLGLLHGCAPQTMVLVIDPTRKMVKHTSHPIPPIGEIIRIYEEMAGLVLPAKVVAVAANTARLPDREAEEVVRRMEDEIGIAAADVLREGPDRIVDAILARHREIGLEWETDRRRQATPREGAQAGSEASPRPRTRPKAGPKTRTKTRTNARTKARAKARTKARAKARPGSGPGASSGTRPAIGREGSASRTRSAAARESRRAAKRRGT